MRNLNSKEIDLITLNVIWQRLISIAEEQAKTLVRSAYSVQTTELQDIASALFDSHGRMIAEGVTGTSGIITALVRGVPFLLTECPKSQISPGDVFICNDPWKFSGHTPDVAIVRPVFKSESVVGFTATISHVQDLGGRGWVSDRGEIYEEGLIFPVTKIVRKDEVNQDVIRLIKANSRVPDPVIGDLMAQVSSTAVGAAKLLEILGEYGLENLDSIADLILSRTEKAIRESIKSCPSGTFHDETNADGWDEPVKIAVSLSFQNDSVLVDFAGSSKQVPAAINATYNYTLAHTVNCLKSVLSPGVPNNGGTYVPINMVAPAASIVNASPPAALISRNLIAAYVNSVVFGALSQALPDRVVADASMTSSPTFRGKDLKGRPFSCRFVCSGGMPARSNRDGLNTTSYPGNVGNSPLEIIENVSPLFIKTKELIQDSGGPGKFRGGLGSRVIFELRGEEPVRINFVFDRLRFPSRGRLGGREGRTTRVYFRGKPLVNGKQSNTWDKNDGEIIVEYPGGGGFFNPEERDPLMVLDDVLNGLVSSEMAAEVYRVAVEGRQINAAKTQLLRNR
jgi:N-methylhydantoinase B